MPLKLLDYGKPNPFGETLGRPRNLAWPVAAFRVTLPRASEDGDPLNPFERVILKILDAGGALDAESLAHETYIPVDLVQSILLRLQDRAFIDEHHEIVEQRRRRWGNEEEQPPVFVTALLFRELATGRILPFLHHLSETKPLKKKEADDRFPPLQISGDDRHQNKAPSPRDVISTLRAMKKRSSAFGEEVHLPRVQHITIAKEPEQYYLDCPIAIQKRDGEFRISDPFGNGFSLSLEHAFNCLLEYDKDLSAWLMRWRQSLSKPRQESSQTSKKKEPYDNDANWGRYRNLMYNLRLPVDEQYRSIERIHASLEWALFYVVAQRPYDAVTRRLKLTAQTEHSDLLSDAAIEIGLKPPPHGFRPIWPGRLNDFLSGQAELSTVLGVALLMAADDPSHPLRHVAAKDGHFIIRLLDMKKQRDAAGHGQGKVRTGDIELPEEPFMRKVVTTLLPSVVFSDTSTAEVDKDASSGLLLDARTGIQAEFSFEIFNRLGTDLQDRLIHAERFWLTCSDGDDALAFACDLYAAVQAAFRQKLSGLLPPDVQDSEFNVLAQEHASQGGLGDLPESLRNVNPIAIRTTLQGNDRTLGACILAFLLVSEADALRSVAENQPSLLSDIETIVVRRGHGNQPLPLPKCDIRQLRRISFQTVKTILET